MKNNKNDEILISGKIPFCMDVPYKLFETGNLKSKKPLIIYLHGFKDNIKKFSDRCANILNSIEAYHLFIQGPYPLCENRGDKCIEDWGTSWYLYDGDQNRFLNSMEKTSSFIDEILNNIKDSISIERVCFIGYSMGGYLAGYYALSRAVNVNDLIVAGARIKTEILKGEWDLISHLNILALHGKHDKLVDYKPQRNEIGKLSDHCIKADFKLIDQKHIFNDEFIRLICDWLLEINYRFNSKIR